MAVASSRGRMDPLRQWRDKDTSPERTKVWKEPKPRKVSVVYYLSRGGQLEHPHFMEVTLSSTDGLYLRDVIDRLNVLRGKGMANLYSWSSKRSYKNGFVWHDLTEDDLIHPTRGHEYVLKGSELLQPLSAPSFQEGNAAFSASEKPLQIPKSVHDDFESLQIRRKRTPWSSFDLNEYKVYKTDLTAETGAKAADASTQTDDGRSRRRSVAAVSREETTELEREDISPPLSSSSSETLEKLIKADARAITAVASGSEDQERTVGTYASGRIRASAVLMHLLSCGSINMKDHHGGSVSPQTPALCKQGAVARAGSDLGGRKLDGLLDNGLAAIRMEDKEYLELDRDQEGGQWPRRLLGPEKVLFLQCRQKVSTVNMSGIPLKWPLLMGVTGKSRTAFLLYLVEKSSSDSLGRNRASKLELAEKEIEGVRAMCIPRKHKTMLEREGGKATNLAQLSRKQAD